MVRVFANVAAACDEAIHWKCNLFRLPSGNAGKSFTHMTSESFMMESIALKASFVMPMLLLQ